MILTMHKDDGKRAFPDQDYIAFDPCEGDRDVDVRLRTVKLVAARKEHPCFFGTGPYGDGHTIQPGDRYRYERALIDSDYWGQYRVCLPCMDKWLRERKGDNAAPTPPAQDDEALKEARVLIAKRGAE